MKLATFLAAITLTVFGVGQLKADLIVGPSDFTVYGSNDTALGYSVYCARQLNVDGI